ncbi:DUF1800 domain-containing protein [Dokdonia sinensis]|uniref:DUF1800 domain-containing protein n=1 Tax=Dokdonia sinensis TaxID=2479847 RepID=A0A3M0GGC5_9FLAO|nr:DUF1800 domain-containing protein [Dokdonia sinensis]RMB64151.1 DUF1800 domain-containing protein [Dokdonia sinensis]
MNPQEIKHLYWRAGFGISPKALSKLEDASRGEVVDTLFEAAKTIKPLEMDLSAFEVLKQPRARKMMEDKKFRELAQKGRKMVKDLNYAWLSRMSEPESVLREKMTLFWTNVFVCRDNAIWHILPYHNLLREHALGNFGDFVKAVAKAPSMSKYLNNRQNRKEKPNENFARELMELFTLGVGNYTEQDIKESARAFTGWSFDRNGDFLLRVRQHDEGVKTFMDETGNWDGDDIIDIILKQKQCARHICTKVYAYFVNPEINSRRVEALTDFFYQDYDIERLMRHIFESDWFYEAQHLGAKIKSPVELMVGIQNVVPVKFQKKKQLLFLQRMMGQVLLDPLNVAGWKGNRSWIDSNTLMFRMNLPSAILANAVIEFSEKGEFEDSLEDYYEAEKTKRRFLKTEPDWSNFEENYVNPLQVGAITLSRNAEVVLKKRLQQHILQAPLDKDTERLLENLESSTTQAYCIQLMSLPEYQMC